MLMDTNSTDNTHRSRWLVSYSVGPVQDFIAAARRTRDLWFGSWLLSDLSRIIALTIATQHRELLQDDEVALQTLIFPAPASWDELENPDFQITNKILAMVQIEPQILSAACRTAVNARLEHLWERAQGKISSLRRGENDEDFAWEQLKDLPEFYATACVMPKNGNYATYRRNCERLLAERKNLRDFNSVSWGASIHKSSLDGQRESVIPEECYPQIVPGEAIEERRSRFTEAYKKLYKHYGLRRAERLCGVGLLKRQGQPPEKEAGSFAACSTSHMAAMPLLCRWQQEHGGQEEARQKIKRYIERVRLMGANDEDLGHAPRAPELFRRQDKGHFFYDGHLLFEERLADFFEGAEEGSGAGAKDLLRQLFEDMVAPGEKPLSPNPYYVLLHADGDFMGKTIDDLDCAQKHRKFSRQLSSFAAQAKTIVNEQSFGSLIYAGGDDVLALLPMHTALSATVKLQDAFKHALFVNSEGKTPTLSAGLVIAHHLDALEDSLQQARDAEKVAKGVKGKNALAVTLSRRGGSPRTVKGARGELDERLWVMVEWHLQKQIARGLAYEWLELEKRLSPTTSQEYGAHLHQVLWLEAARIMGRKRESGGGEGLEKKVADQLKIWLDQSSASSGEHEEGVLEALANELIVSAALAEAMEQAYGRDKALATVRKERESLSFKKESVDE